MLRGHFLQAVREMVRLPDGTLAGSALTLDQALRNLVHTLGLTVQDASRRVSTSRVPATEDAVAAASRRS